MKGKLFLLLLIGYAGHAYSSQTPLGSLFDRLSYAAEDFEQVFGRRKGMK
jgi:hypothetical protein